MNKDQFTSFIADNNEITKTEAAKIVNIFTESVARALSKKEPVALTGFGTFDITHTKQREGRNPSTGQPMVIKASNRPTFKAGKTLKDRVK